MRTARSSGRCALPWQVLVLLALAACSRVPKPSHFLQEEFRGGGMRPWKISQALTPKGQRVVVHTAPPATCSFAGLVSGVMLVPGERPLGQTREDLERSLSWQAAIDDLRNIAGQNGANAVVLEGHGHEEHHGELKHDTYFHVYGRAFLCPEVGPEAPPARPGS